MSWAKDEVSSKRFLDALLAMQEALPRDKQLSDQAIKLYAASLQDIPLNDVLKACVKASMQCEFFPKPVELRNLALGSADDTAEIEATKALGAIGSVGAYRSVVFDNPVTQAVIMRSFGGWPKFCEMLESERKWRHQEFVKAYKAFAAQNVRHFGELHGIAATHNGAHAVHAAPQVPAIVGDPHKAKEILSLQNENTPGVLLGGLKELMSVVPEEPKALSRSDVLDQVEILKRIENKG